MAKAIKLIRAGKEVDYEGAFSPVDFDENGDIGSAVFEIWKYSAPGKIDTLKHGHLQGLSGRLGGRRLRGSRRLPRPPR